MFEIEMHHVSRSSPVKHTEWEKKPVKLIITQIQGITLEIPNALQTYSFKNAIPIFHL